MVVNDIDPEVAEATVRVLTSNGGRAVALVGDVTEPTFPDRLLQAALDAFGDLHILVNNAGYVWNASALKHTDDQWAAMLEVHATAPFRILRCVGAHFRQAHQREGGTTCRKVVNVSSISGYYGAALQFSYAAAKAAIIGMTRSLAKEWGRYNVTVNCVALGYIDTRLNPTYDERPPTLVVGERSVKVGLDAKTRAEIEHLTPLGRFGSPAEAAGAISLLCRPESDFVSGQVLMVAGGLVY